MTVWFYIYKFISTLFGRFTSVRLLSAAQSQYNIIFFTLGFAYGLRLSNSFFSDAATSGLVLAVVHVSHFEHGQSPNL